MGKVQKPCPVKLITGIISSSKLVLNQAEKKLIHAFGRIDYRSEIIDFNFTDYYAKEMGVDLKRRFLSFSKHISPEQLPKIKIFTNRMEKSFARKIPGSKRSVNIDPGYITDAKLVLASTKDYRHRIYLSRGIYAETTLFYQKNTFKPYDWTYPDYRTDYYIRVFNEIRSIFMCQRRF